MKINITRINTLTKQVLKTEDFVAEEKPLQIYINQKHYATILCTPSHLKELAVGHLLTEHIIHSIEELDKVVLRKKGICRVLLKPNVKAEKRLKISRTFARVILSACGASTERISPSTTEKISSDSRVKAETVSECVRHLNTLAKTYRATGGVHAAAIYTVDGSKISFSEDIGRHNAVDKSIGHAALDRRDFGSCFLVLTGRLTSDIVHKASRVGIPVVASLAAAVDSGIQIARDAGLTLIGFVRGHRMNIYTSPERIFL